MKGKSRRNFKGFDQNSVNESVYVNVMLNVYVNVML